MAPRYYPLKAQNVSDDVQCMLRILRITQVINGCVPKDCVKSYEANDFSIEEIGAIRRRLGWGWHRSKIRSQPKSLPRDLRCLATFRGAPPCIHGHNALVR